MQFELWGHASRGLSASGLACDTKHHAVDKWKQDTIVSRAIAIDSTSSLNSSVRRISQITKCESWRCPFVPLAHKYITQLNETRKYIYIWSSNAHAHCIRPHISEPKLSSINWHVGEKIVTGRPLARNVVCPRHHQFPTCEVTQASEVCDWFKFY